MEKGRAGRWAGRAVGKLWEGPGESRWWFNYDGRAGVSYSPGLGSAGKLPETSGRRGGSEQQKCCNSEVLLLEQDKATTHPFVYLKHVLIGYLLFAGDCARSWDYSSEKYSHGSDLTTLTVCGGVGVGMSRKPNKELIAVGISALKKNLDFLL